MNNLQINKWNIYNAKVPFIIVLVTSNLQKINKYSVKINLNEKSVIKTGNIIHINKSDFISPYYLNSQIVRLDNTIIKQIKNHIYSIIFKDKKMI